MELLANKVRPTKLNEVLGQDHLIGKDKILTNLIKNKKLFSMIFYGPPGTGKTSIAKALINELGLPFKELNATMSKKDDFVYAINEARMSNDFILVVDEIHRMNKDKQDILLPYLEDGTIILIGLTTANPFYKVNPAIRSRTQIFEVKLLEKKDIIKGLNKVTKTLDNITIDKESIDYVADTSRGDYRFALNLLEVAYYSSSEHIINLKLLQSIQNKPSILTDKDEDYYYNLLSAFQKSIRGSDVDASLHYLAKLILIEDLDILYRRLTVIGYEDIGLANPGINIKISNAITSCERVGLPEATLILGNIVVEMALSPKSNSTYLAVNKAMNDVKLGLGNEIPPNITHNSSTYKYPHDYTNNYIEENYMPKDLLNKKYYVKQNSNIEKQLNDVFERMKNK